MNLNSTTLQERFTRYIAAHQLFTKGDRLLLGVSGGLDSVVLCQLCFSAGYSFSIAHCNFSLRGAESNRDEAFVRSLAERYAVPFFVQHFDTATFAQNHKLSIQEAARKLRYDWFAEMVNGEWSMVNDAEKKSTFLPAGMESFYNTGYPPSGIRHSRILTAHHLDDNIETVVMHFFKGTGISGLRGMLPKQHKLVRPLLFAKRSELEGYAREQQLKWVEDSSNAQIKYTRNFFRHEVLPLVAQKFPQAMENVAANINRFADTEQLYMQAIEQHKKKLLEYRGEEIHIPVLKLAKALPLHTIMYEILKPFGFTPGQTADVLHLLEAESGRFVRSATHQVLRHRRWLVIGPIAAHEPSLVVVEKEDRQVCFGVSQLDISGEPVPKKLAAPPEVALLDVKQVRFPLVLRRWKAGDYFYPLGMAKKKKVSRFLIDLKLSRTDKEKVWVLESGKKIAWVVGYRIDDRFKITPSTQSILRLTSIPLKQDNTAHPG